MPEFTESSHPDPLVSGTARPAEPGELPGKSAEETKAWRELTLDAARRQYLRQIRSIVLLAGSVHVSPLAKAVGRPLLDLPIADGRNLLDLWRHHALRLSGLADLERVPVRILMNAAAPMPTLVAGDAEMGLNVEVDPFELRGTAGVLRDLCCREVNDDDGAILVATAAQVLTEPLGELVESLAATGGDACLLSYSDGMPSGIMFIRRRCLRDIPEEGFIDMKEQGLPMIAKKHRVTSLCRRKHASLPVRTREDYCHALHVYHRLSQGAFDLDDPFAERWQSAGHVAESGATVDPTARLHDSVILSGAQVGAGAMLVRSVVCAGAIVQRNQTVLDQLVTGDSGK